uniref:FN3 associated domain-containing protein n=1 Tax=Alloprevotella sp. TaxID=1872471 RepID=UPI003FEF1B53
MRTKLLSLKTLLVICLMAIVGGVETWADTYKYTFTSKVFEKTSTTSKENLETQKLGDVSWTTSGVIPYLGFGGDSNGMQFGKKNNPADFSLTTSDIVGTITKVVVNASTTTKNTVTLSVSVGGEQYGTEQITSTTSRGYTFSGKSTGKVAISMKSNGTKGMYIKSIEITYTPSSSSSVAAPTFSEDSKSFSDKFGLTLSAGSDAAMIMYTTDGKTPSYKNNVGELYDEEAPISITHSTTVKAIAVSSKGEESDVVTKEYKLELPAPIISEATKTFTAPFTVSLSTTATAAEAILYTLDGTVPSRENKATVYTKPIQISATTTLKAVSYATNGTTYEYSPIATATYTEQGDAPIVIWSEDWSAFKEGIKPTKGENATYVCKDGASATKIYNGTSAGGVSPELLINKSGGSLAITISDLKGVTNGLMFTFKTNRDESEFQVSADNATILSNEVIGDSKYTRKYIMVLNEGATSLTITLKNSSTDSNARVDDLELSTYVGNFNITEAGYGTYYSSKAYIMPKGVKGYTITGSEGTSLVMNEAYAAGDVVPAKTALVVEGAANKYYTLVAASTELTPADNKLHGSDEAETTYVDGTDVKYYKLSYNNEGNNLGFYWGSENGAAFTNGAHKAYLALNSETLLSQSRGFSLADLAHGVTTGINTTVKSATQSNFIYDLNGRRINSLNGAAKGVYIMNGQKVLVK